MCPKYDIWSLLRDFCSSFSCFGSLLFWLKRGGPIIFLTVFLMFINSLKICNMGFLVPLFLVTLICWETEALGSLSSEGYFNKGLADGLETCVLSCVGSSVGFRLPFVNREKYISCVRRYFSKVLIWGVTLKWISTLFLLSNVPNKTLDIKLEFPIIYLLILGNSISLESLKLRTNWMNLPRNISLPIFFMNFSSPGVSSFRINLPTLRT